MLVLVTYIVAISLANSLPTNDKRCLKAVSTQCVPLDPIPQCFGANMTFNQTTFVYTGLPNIGSTLKKLDLWKGLRFVPGCWAVVQPFLCSVYLPKCDNGTVQRPSKEDCTRIHEACKVVTLVTQWPSFLRCEAEHFTPRCRNEYMGTPFNRTGHCPHPLVATDTKDNWHPDVPGCGIPWHDPMYKDSEQNSVHVIIGVLASLGLLSTLFTVLTYAIDWHNSKRYPAIILFYINVCLFISTVGWLAQFAGDARRDIVSRRDGTARRNEPNIGSGETASCTIIFILIYYPTMAACVWSGETASCTIIFILIYYPTMAACVWFVMLTYTRHISFKSLGTPRDDLRAKVAYLHIVSWFAPLILSVIALIAAKVMQLVTAAILVSIPRDHLRAKVAYLHIVSWFAPLILSVIALIAAKVDADSITGICFISDRDVAARLCLLIMPTIIIFIASLHYLIKSLHTLVEIRKDTPENLISHRAIAKIHEASIRMGIFAGLSILMMLTSLCIHIYTFAFRPHWDDSLRNSIICRAMVVSHNSNATLASCDMNPRPSAVATAIHVATYFLFVMAMSSWSWTRASVHSWERFIRRLLHKPSDKPVRLKKHHMIRRAFEKKKKRKGTRGSRISISFCSTHDDPLGMRIELQSGSSHEISSFAAAMPMLMARRGGMVANVAGSNRRYSDSDVGSMASKMSRRQSIDSQLNALGITHVNESDHRTLANGPPKKPRRNKKRKTTRRVTPSILALPKNIRLGRLTRRGSDTSNCSNGSEKRDDNDVRKSHDLPASRPMSRSSKHASSLNDLPGVVPDYDSPANNRTDFAIFTASGLKPRAIEFMGIGSDSPCVMFDMPSADGMFRRTDRRVDDQSGAFGRTDRRGDGSYSMKETDSRIQEGMVRRVDSAGSGDGKSGMFSRTDVTDGHTKSEVLSDMSDVTVTDLT